MPPVDIGTVLVVDDSPLLLETTAALLEERGYGVVAVGSGADALDALQTVRPDAIVCDLHMPLMDGYAVIAAVREREAHLPIIILSSEDDVNAVLQAVRAGAFDYVMKGNVDDGRIVTSIDRAVAHYRVLRENDVLGQELAARLRDLDVANLELQREVETRTKAQEALREAVAVAVAASTAKSRFLASMSHEFRTPLNAILGYTELLMEEDLPPMALQDLERVRGSGMHLLTLINDVLDLSKIEAGHMTLALELTSGDDLFSALHSMAKPLVDRNSNRFDLMIPEAIGNVYVDAHRLKQIVLNLLGNAAKFTMDGHIVLAARRAAVNARAGLQVTVQDTGIGLTDEQCSRLFREFEQADAGTSGKYGGTGLGLAISRKLAVLMGGSIEVESEAGRGSLFRLWIPIDAHPTAE